MVLEVFHDDPFETGHLVRSVSIHGVASPAGNEERALSVEMIILEPLAEVEAARDHLHMDSQIVAEQPAKT